MPIEVAPLTTIKKELSMALNRGARPTAPARDHTRTVVVGAGQAGLSISRLLTAAGHEHVVLERRQVGDTWRTARWDSFRLITPAHMSTLTDAGQPYKPGYFISRDELLQGFERYVEKFDLPIRCGVEVSRLAKNAGAGYLLCTGAGSIHADAVVIASGGLRVPKIPAVAHRLPRWVRQLHAADYRSPGRMLSGATLVVGNGQSGSQIAQELARAGRRTYLCTSRVRRLPRVHRGRDMLTWWNEMGVYDEKASEVAQAARLTQPVVSVHPDNQAISLQQLAREGVQLLGRLLDVDSRRLVLSADLAEHIVYADESALGFRQAVDDHIERTGTSAPPHIPDPAEAPQPGLGGSVPRVLDLRDVGITTVLWCTGFTADLGWVDLDIFDSNGHPAHDEGVTSIPGCFLLGFPWLITRGSGVLAGVGKDARKIANAVLAATR
jgi:putative flavoprotein involved in K+ transport